MEEITPKIKIVFKGRREDEITPIEEENNFQEESPSKLKIKIKTRSNQESEDGIHKRKGSFEDQNSEKKQKIAETEENDVEGQDKIAPLRKILGSMLNNIIKKDRYQLFNDPVSAEEVPDYHSIIKSPMDFFTMRKKLRGGKYTSLQLFENDFHLICNNAMTYNAPNTLYYKEAKKLLTKGDQIIDNYDLRIQELSSPVSTTTSASTSSGATVNRRSSSKSKGLTSTSTRRISSAIAPLSGVTKYSMYIPKNTITLSSQQSDKLNNVSNPNVYNNYIDNYMYCKPSMPIYSHNFENRKSSSVFNDLSKYMNEDATNKVKHYLNNLLSTDVNMQDTDTTTTTTAYNNNTKELQDTYEEYKEYFHTTENEDTANKHELNKNKLRDNILHLQELQVLQYERTDANLTEKEKILFYSVQNNLKQFTETLIPKEVFNQVEEILK